MQELNDQNESETNAKKQMLYFIGEGENQIGLTVVEYLYHLDTEIKKSKVVLDLAIAEREVATAFQIKSQSILWGLAELRFALGSPQIDDNKEASSFSSDKVAVKSAFEDDIDKRILRQRYIALSKIYIDFVSQIKVKSAME